MILRYLSSHFYTYNVEIWLKKCRPRNPNKNTNLMLNNIVTLKSWLGITQGH